jgi:hypothetical protein
LTRGICCSSMLRSLAQPLSQLEFMRADFDVRCGEKSVDALREKRAILADFFRPGI